MNKILLFLGMLLLSQAFYTQELEVQLQLRPRFEYRNGFKTLLDNDQDPNSFISQRSRLNLKYSNQDLRLKFSLQNIRVWGDVPTIATSDQNGIGIFEAFADYSVTSHFWIRVGRQILSYDNQRIFGGLDWAQQGQSHDAFVTSWMPGANHQIDLGFALNSDAENLAKAPYLINNYKNMQYGWYHLNFKTAGLSLLFANNGYEFDNSSSGREVQYIQTFGAFFNFKENVFSGDISFYGQTGESNSQLVRAYYAGANLDYNISSHWQAGIGAEYFTGKDMNDTSGGKESFFPLFGTNHGFNGLMDYFFVGNHQNSVGLIDYYGKVSYRYQKFSVSAIPHLFYSEAQIYSEIGNEDTFLGTEIDVVGSYKINQDINIGMGYSQMFGTHSLEVLKGGRSKDLQNWAWAMVSFHPTLFSTKKPPGIGEL